MDQSYSGTKIGYISANIDGDHRYTSRVEVYVDFASDQAFCLLLENGAVGGMDGPGGSTPFRITDKRVVKPTAKDVLNGVKSVMDDTIRRYGKPTKRFSWVGTEKQGLSQALAGEAIVFAKGDVEEDV